MICDTEILAMTMLKGIGPKTIKDIINTMTEDGCDSLLNLNLSLLATKIRPQYYSILEDSIISNKFHKYYQIASDKINFYNSNNIVLISYMNPSYPKILLLADNFPLFLYCKGNISLLNNWNNIAVIGTRDNTELGDKITRKSVDFLCSKGFVIVSGLALGIDSIAHEQTLINNGKTIAILVDVENVQPAKNRQLADNILKNNGLWIAENPPGTKIVPGHFVSRDRIQSGLAAAVFAIETSKNGGTMHAVNNCLKEERLLFCPDLSKLSYMPCKQIEGIEDLLSEKKAIPYSKETYSVVTTMINEMIEKLQQPKKTQRGLFD